MQKKLQKIMSKKSIISLALILFAAIFFEVFVCNYRYFESRNYQSVQTMDMVMGDGITKEEDGLYYLGTDGEKTITLTNLNTHINNIRIGIEKVNVAGDTDENAYETVTLQLYAKDAGNSEFFAMPERTVARSSKRSEYIKLDLAGDTPELKIDLGQNSECYIRIHDIACNVTVPFAFSKLRFVIELFACVCIWGFVHVTSWSSIRFDRKSKKQKLIAAMIVLVQISIWSVIGSENPYFATEWIYRQYYDLVAALDAGQAELMIDVDPALAAMDNPYDNGLRQAEGINYSWDYAFYNGKYYLYFGIVPALLVYYPYFKLTGTNIPNNQVVLLGMAFAAVGMLLLLRKLADKYFKNVSAVLFYAMYVLTINAMGCAFMAHRPDFYSVPGIYAMAFTLWGLYAWLCAADRRGRSRLVLLFAGAWSMALVAGCRPQFLVADAFFLVLIGPQWIEQLKEKKRSVWLELIVTAVPYVIVAAGLMYYNQIRFGSPFDFGANYNLTTNDMTSRGWKLDRVGLGIFAYLFMPPRIRCIFPFLNNAYVDSVYQGVTISEEMYGGAFAICPFVLIGVFALFCKNLYENKKLYIAHAMSVAFAVIIVIADTQMAGILYRYMSDFMVFLLVPACMAVMYLEPKLKNNICYVPIVRCFLAILAYSFVLYSFLYMVLDAYNFQQMNPSFFYRISSIVQFWL